jgi:hypothetical protein
VERPVLPGLSSRATFQKRQRQTVAVRFLRAKIQIKFINQEYYLQNYYYNCKYATKIAIKT